MSATYNVNHYKIISAAESNHFWFKARNTMLASLVHAFIPVIERKSFLEVGCGTGIVLGTLKSLGFTVTGLDVNQTALDFAKAKHTGAHLIRQSLFTYTSPRPYSAIGAFDVLEHQSHDLLFLKRCYGLLEKDGNLLLTVPASMRLWSFLDAVSGHKRRYGRDGLAATLTKAGFSIRFMNYWSVLTLPFYILYRLGIGRRRTSSTLDMYLAVPHPFVNRLFYGMLSLERLFFTRIPFPFGATLVVCAKKQGE